MLSAIGRISPGREAGTPRTHASRSESVMAQVDRALLMSLGIGARTDY